MRKTVVLATATAALVVPAGAALAQAQLPQLPQLPTSVSTAPYVDPSLVRLDIDTSDGLRAALHVSRSKVIEINLGDYIDTDFMATARGLVRSLDLDCSSSVVDCASVIVARIATMPKPAVPNAPSPASIVSTVTTTVNSATSTATNAVTSITTQVKTTVSTVQPSLPKPPAVTVPSIPVPQLKLPAPPAVPTVPAAQSLIGFVGATLDATLATVDNTVDAVVGTTPAVPAAPAPQSLLGGLLG